MLKTQHNLYENLKIENFLIFPGSEAKKLLKGLELGNSGTISAIVKLLLHLLEKFLMILKKRKADAK